MPDLFSFDYAVIRVVPRVEREEFLNVGVLFSCFEQSILAARIELDEPRLTAFAPELDCAHLQEYLHAVVCVANGGKN
ncbi:MAG TPA: DUF3037 domain-containing protein, partial [Abditibacteriaceae bacterium]